MTNSVKGGDGYNFYNNYTSCYFSVGKILLAVKVIIRAWKNYLLQRKYRNILEDFRRKVYHKTIKKYIDNRMEIFNDIKEIQFDMTSNDKSVEYLKKRVKLIETFEAQGMRSLCCVFFF